MTIYDLTEAIKRHARFLVVAFSILVIGVLILSFSIEDGSLGWRAKQKYESSVQIAVVSPETTSLTTTDVRNDSLRSTASVYESLIETGEAKLAVGEIAGYELDDPIEANLDDQAPIITATVIAPTPEQSIAAAEGVFTWLTTKLETPIDTAGISEDTTPTTIPLILLDGPFDSAVTVAFDDSLGSIPEETFLQIGFDAADPTTLAVASNAGTTVSAGATLDTTISFVLRLIGGDDAVIDTVRIAPPPLQPLVQAIPALSIELRASSISATAINPDQVELAWIDDVRDTLADEDPVLSNEVDIALLTSEIGVNPIGGRRGPITAVAVLAVGALVLLAVVVVSESWRRARIAAASTGPADVVDGSSDGSSVAPEGESGDPTILGTRQSSDPTDSAPSRS